MSKPRIGLFTFYTGNYGACLQAFATQRYVREKLGGECVIVRTDPGVRGDTPWTRLFLRGGIFHGPLAKIRRRLRRRTPVASAFAERLSVRVEAFKRFERDCLVLDENQNRLFSEYYRNPPDYDIYLSGSDQVWNPLAFSRCNPIYYLDIAPLGRPRVSYASSFAISEVPLRYLREMKRFLTRFDRISVRENDGARIVERLTGRRPPVVVDPTFLLTREDWLRVSGKSTMVPEEPYILFYRLGTFSYFDWFKEHILEKTRMRPVVIPIRAEDDPTGDGEYNAGPLDFVSLLARAALVVTDSFHGVALSVNLGVPFYALLRQDPAIKGNMNSRVLFLLERLRLNDRLVLPRTKFLDAPSFEAPAADSSELSAWRDVSADYLTEILGRNH
jgi:hypothetical protein